jgi:zinc transporter
MNAPGARLFYCVRLDGRGGFMKVQPGGAGTDEAGAGVEWVHFDTADQAARDWLQQESGVDGVIVDALTAAETRPRAFSTERGVFLILRGVNLNPGANAEDMVSIRLWIEKHRIISTYRRPLLSVADLVAALEQGTGPTSSGTFVTDLIERLTDRIGNFVDDIEGRLESTEQALATLQLGGVRQRLGALRRQIASVRRFLAPQRDALDRLCRNPLDCIGGEDVTVLREQSDRLARYLEDLDLARERSVVLQEELLSQLAQEQNARMYVLSVVAVVFLPLTFITGLLGMNVGGLPGTQSNAGFIGSMVAMAIATIVIVVLLKWKKWI